jgi:hypothetical protein
MIAEHKALRTLGRTRGASLASSANYPNVTNGPRRMEPIDSLRGKLSALAGTPLDDEEVADLLAEVVGSGGGVHVEIDDGSRYKLIRRDGKFVLTKDSSRTRPSTMPPRR